MKFIFILFFKPRRQLHSIRLRTTNSTHKRVLSTLLFSGRTVCRANNTNVLRSIHAFILCTYFICIYIWLYKRMLLAGEYQSLASHNWLGNVLRIYIFDFHEEKTIQYSRESILHSQLDTKVPVGTAHSLAGTMMNAADSNGDQCSLNITNPHSLTNIRPYPSPNNPVSDVYVEHSPKNWFRYAARIQIGIKID